MSERPSVLFYCQHSLGMGHLVRSMALASGLSRRLRVVFLNGGPLPKGIRLPNGVEMIHLPPLGQGPDGQLVSRDRRRTVARAIELRRATILDAFRSLRPQVLLIELFPFGRKKFAGELLPLLDEADKSGSARPVVVCSLRDILVGKRADQQKHDERAVSVANNYFDAVLVHSDPAFARLEESLHPQARLTAPVHYTGYVASEKGLDSKPSVTRRRRVVVSAGGGLVGYTLFKTAIEAHALLQDEELEMRIIAGPFLPEQQWQALRAASQQYKRIQLVRHVTDLCEEMSAAAASISQCGYNTALDILRSRVAALVVPFAEGGEDEQTRRAERLERLEAVRVLSHTRLDAASLAGELRVLLNFKPQAHRLNLQGVRNSLRILEELLQITPQNAMTFEAATSALEVSP